MAIKLEGYRHGYRIASLALDLESKEKLLEQDLNIIYVDNSKVYLLPEEVLLTEANADIKSFNQLNNYDVLEIWDNGFINTLYNDKSEDNYFFVTGACNSNCIMCPSPEGTRKNVAKTNVLDLIEFARYIPSDTPHLTVTGGEPFLIGESIFPFIKYLKEKFSYTDFLFLTNGRVFAIDRFVEQFIEVIPDYSIIAVPIHGSCADVHDKITRSKGSFNQTLAGIKKLLKNDLSVEIRLVVSSLNVFDLDNIANLIIEEFKNIEYVSVIAMEMTGNARVNMDKVWITYKEAFKHIATPVRKMVESGIDVKLYNFPICTVEKPFWTLCQKSISTNKVKFAETCDMCRYKSVCGGVFAGTFSLERDELEAII